MFMQLPHRGTKSLTFGDIVLTHAHCTNFDVIVVSLDKHLGWYNLASVYIVMGSVAKSW